MKTTERQLDLFEKRKHQLDEDVAVLTSHLYMAARWQTREQLCRALDWTDRRVRAAREASGGVVIFGQNGLKHMRHATPEEAMACKNTLLSQATKMQHGAMEVDRSFHSWGGKAVSA